MTGSDAIPFSKSITVPKGAANFIEVDLIKEFVGKSQQKRYLTKLGLTPFIDDDGDSLVKYILIVDGKNFKLDAGFGHGLAPLDVHSGIGFTRELIIRIINSDTTDDIDTSLSGLVEPYSKGYQQSQQIDIMKKLLVASRSGQIKELIDKRSDEYSEPNQTLKQRLERHGTVWPGEGDDL